MEKLAIQLEKGVNEKSVANINAEKFKNKAKQLKEEIQKLDNLMKLATAEAD